jgi:hypothetical protein
MTGDLGPTDMDVMEEAIGGADLAIPVGVNPFGKFIHPSQADFTDRHDVLLSSRLGCDDDALPTFARLRF